MAFLSLGDVVLALTGAEDLYLTSGSEGVPHAVLHNLKHNMVVHERIIIPTLDVLDVPRVAPAQRVLVERLSPGFWREELFVTMFRNSSSITSLLRLPPNRVVEFGTQFGSWGSGLEARDSGTRRPDVVRRIRRKEGTDERD